MQIVSQLVIREKTVHYGHIWQPWMDLALDSLSKETILSKMHAYVWDKNTIEKKTRKNCLLTHNII